MKTPPLTMRQGIGPWRSIRSMVAGDPPPLTMRQGIGPWRSVVGREGGLALRVVLSCGHAIYGEFARRQVASMRCPMCAGCGPDAYMCVGRARSGHDFTYEVRERRPGRPRLVGAYLTRRSALRKLEELSGGIPLPHIS